MGLCIAVGFKKEGGGEPVHKYFASRDADAVRQWMDEDTECKVFTIYHNKLGRRKANPNYIAPAVAGTPPAPEVTPEAEAAPAAKAPDIVAEQQAAEAEDDGALPLESAGKLSGKRKPPAS